MQSTLKIIHDLKEIYDYPAELIFLDISGTLLCEDIYRDLLESQGYYKVFLNTIAKEPKKIPYTHKAPLSIKDILFLSKYTPKKTTQNNTSEIIQSLCRDSTICALTSGYPSIIKKRQIFTKVAKMPVFFTVEDNKGKIIINILNILQNQFNITIKNITVVDNHYSKLIDIQESLKTINHPHMNIFLLFYKNDLKPIYSKDFKNYWKLVYKHINSALNDYENIKKTQAYYQKYYAKEIFPQNIQTLVNNLRKKRLKKTNNK